MTPGVPGAEPGAARGADTAVNPGAEDLWVFGYGSLMWDPRFDHVESVPGRVHGYHRALCLLSVRNRGTPDKPGLVVALDRGGSCRGIAFRVAAPGVAATRAYLWQREMYTNAYRPLTVPLRLDDGRRVPALTFAAAPGHPQHCRPATPEHAAALVLQGRGTYGTSLDYLRNVIHHLDAFGIPDGPLHHILALAEAAVARDGASPHGIVTSPMSS